MRRALTLTILLAATAAAAMDPPPDPFGTRRYEGERVFAGDEAFDSWRDFAEALEWRYPNRACAALSATRGRTRRGDTQGFKGECARNFTSASPLYDQIGGPLLRIPIVFHVIRTDDGAIGHLSAERVLLQLKLLNDDFRAVAGTEGGASIDTRIEFQLASVDPDGNPASGINYYNNSDWFNDPGSEVIETPYADAIAWDPQRYLNVYTNDCNGWVAYASIPQFETYPEAGSIHDRIVLRWDLVGETPEFGVPRKRGHTLSHEAGHYLGLWHTFQTWPGENICTDPCNCQGDAICDTNPQSTIEPGCEGSLSCGLPPNKDNFMSAATDVCRIRFTPMQIRRMRCTLMNWRPMLAAYIDTPCNPDCGADFNYDNEVNRFDLTILCNAWGECEDGDCCQDLNGDGVVDFADLGLLFDAYGACGQCPEGWEKDCNGTCFPSEWIEWWRGDSYCDSGIYVPSNNGCAECPQGVPMYLNCDQFNNDDGDCP